MFETVPPGCGDTSKAPASDAGRTPTKENRACRVRRITQGMAVPVIGVGGCTAGGVSVGRQASCSLSSVSLLARAQLCFFVKESAIEDCGFFAENPLTGGVDLVDETTDFLEIWMPVLLDAMATSSPLLNVPRLGSDILESRIVKSVDPELSGLGRLTLSFVNAIASAP